ncbi:MAG: hypothetical protein QOG33_892, partial [Gaiellales bacterium]|nr:hypothetical protein [Gaiellales bacterium]
QARPAGVGVHRDAGAAVSATGGVPTTSIAAAAPVTSPATHTGGGMTLAQIAGLAGLTLVGVVLIAGWSAAHFGRRVRPIPH